MTRPPGNRSAALLRELARGLDWRVAVILLTATFSLLYLEYAAIRPVFLEQPRPIPTENLAVWALNCFAVWFVIPALIAVLFLRKRLRDIGLSFAGTFRHLRLYVVLYLCVVPLIYLASLDPDFQSTYPFADSARYGLEAFITWELIYGVQFFSLEFFFRGFMIFGLEERFGKSAILVMVVPYCMLHFHKPMPEALGAIGAGLVLGAVALRTRSILGGVAVHWAVAITMDLMAILQRGG